MRSPVGCHVSMAGGVSQAVGRAQDRGCEAIQIFTTSPRAWAHQAHPDDEIEKFVAGVVQLGKLPVVVHASYLINLGTADPALAKKSASLLSETGRWASRLGVTTVILHPGQATDGDVAAASARVAAGIAGVMRDWPAGLTLSLEQSAGQKGSVGGRFEDLAAVLDALHGDARVRVWLDTAHAFGAGWDVRSGDGVGRLAADIGRTVGHDRIAGVHANDSKVPLGSKKDRHENVGEGTIGRDGLAAMLAHPAFRGRPFLLETPGFDGLGPDLENMNRLKELRDRAGV